MSSVHIIQELAWQKFEDAEHLFNKERFDSAFYIAGYTIELLLKAKICTTIGMEDFFHFDGSPKLLSKEAYRPFKVHDFSQLMVLSGIYKSFKKNALIDEEFKDHWTIINDWSEDCRYFEGRKGEDVKKFLTSVKFIATWIEKQL